MVIRAVNDRIFDLLSGFRSEDGDFLCECSNGNCIETIHLTLREYSALQARPDRPPLKLPGHLD
jgi:hypothetical protein